MIQAFPFEILYLIFSLLDHDDLLNASLTCNALNSARFRLVYKKLYLTWEEVETIALDYYNDEFRLKVAHDIKIEPHGRGEWSSSPKISMI